MSERGTPSPSPQRAGRSGKYTPANLGAVLHAVGSSIVAICLAFCPSRASGESGQATGVVLIGGIGVTRGDLALTAPTALVETRIDALPTIRLGVEAWPSTAIGLYAAADVGTGASLGVPGVSDALSYNVHQLRAGGWYRWQPDAGGDGWDLRAGLGMHGTVQRVQAQHPALLVDSEVAGPAIEARIDRFFRSRRVRVGVVAGAEAPFFVRESPQDTGDAGRFYGWSAGLDADWRWSGVVTLGLELRHGEQIVVFRGEGTRATGIEGGRTHDAFTTGVFLLRYSL